MQPGENHPELGKMQAQLRIWEKSGDRRGVFLSCYSLMTQNMLEAIRQKRFHDGDWVLRWLIHFSDFYFAALEGYERKAPNLPLPWKIAFDATRDPSTFILQNLFLGINAHINFDLIIALSNILEAEWDSLSPEKKMSRYLDFCTVNEIIAGTLDAAEDRIIKPFVPLYSIADELLGPLNEWMAVQFITNWRDRVWRLVVRFLDTKDWQLRQGQIRYFEMSAADQARAFLLSDLTDHFTDMV